MAQKMNDEFMQTIINEEAWKKLSGEFSWTEGLLEKYQDKVDWEEISSNEGISWTIPMLKKFAKKINWTKFSKEALGRYLTPDNLEIFKDYWDWHELSNNIDVRFTDELLEKYADYWDWERIINPDHYGTTPFENRAEEFYNKFQKYIPVSKLQESRLWSKMVEAQKERLISEIIA